MIKPYPDNTGVISFHSKPHEIRNILFFTDHGGFEPPTYSLEGYRSIQAELMTQCHDPGFQKGDYCIYKGGGDL